MELFKHATGTEIVHIPYKGTSGVMSDLIGNHVSAMFVPTHVALPIAEGSRIRILGVASDRAGSAAPDVPTFDRAGHPWFRGRSVVRPAGAGRNARRRDRALQRRAERVPALPAVDELAKQGLVTAGGSPEVLRDLIASDMAKWRKVISEAGITAE